MKTKILIYGDSNLNIVDGSSIWVISLAKLLAQDKNNLVDILLKREISDDVLVQSLQGVGNIRILPPKSYDERFAEVDSANINRIIEKVDEYRDYSCIIVRGFDVVKSMLKSNLSSKMIPYITDFTHDRSKISAGEKENLFEVYSKTNYMFVQTEEMRKYLKDILEVDGSKFRTLYPMVFDDGSEEVAKEPKSIVYAGKISKEWHIFEILETMEKLYEIDPEIRLHFIGNTFKRDVANKDTIAEINKRLANAPNISYHGALPRKQTADVVKRCQLGYAFRAKTVDNDNSLELSMKVLEYCSYGVIPIIRKIEMYKAIFGDEFPMFVDSVDDTVEKVASIFKDDRQHEELACRSREIFEAYTPEQSYANIKDAIYSYPKKKQRMLISGHDLKFLKPLYKFFEQDFELSVQELKDYMVFDQRQSKELLRSADIVWCEWMLLNAEWYSNNAYPHQKLFIRAHRFEITKRFGFSVNMANVEKIITVSYFYYEEFIRKFSFPRSKVAVVNNFVETELYDAEKSENCHYNIALIGALPMQKGLSEAVDVLAMLKRGDDRYKLIVPGKRPEEFPATWNVEEERQYYLEVYQKIKDLQLEEDVIFSGWVNIPELLKTIGFTLSLSEIESFHLAIAETMASKSLGLCLKWDGIEYVYPEYCMCDSIEEIAETIDRLTHDKELYDRRAEQSRNFIIEKYDIEKIYRNALSLMEGS